MENNKNNVIIDEFNRVKANIRTYYDIESLTNRHTSSQKHFSFESYLNLPDSNLNSYSDDSKESVLFLSNFFSIPRESKQYLHINPKALEDPFFLLFILNNQQNLDLLMLFDEKLLDRAFENCVINTLTSKKIPILKYCPKEHYTKNSEYSKPQIDMFLITKILENNENFDYLPKEYKNNDIFFKKIIEKSNSNNLSKYLSNSDSSLPLNIFNQRTPSWWNKNSELFKYIVENKLTFNDYNFKNVKKNPFFFYLLIQKDCKMFKKSKEIDNNSVERILAAQYYSEKHNKPLTEETFLSDYLINDFKKDLPSFLFKKHTTSSSCNSVCSNWNDFFSQHTISTDKSIYPSKKFTTLVQQIMGNISEEQYKNMEIFKHTTSGNPLLTLNLALNNKPQNFMLNDCLVVAHQNLFINENYELYFFTIKNLLTINFKFVNDTLKSSINKKIVNIQNMEDVINYVIPLIEERYLEHIIPKNITTTFKPKIKF